MARKSRFRSRIKGTPEYRRRQERIRARRGTPGRAGTPGTPGSPTPQPYLDPQQQSQVLSDWYGLIGEGVSADQDLADVMANDPLVQTQIEDNYKRAVGVRGESLASRGLSATGVNDAQVWDVKRARDLSLLNQANVVKRAQDRHTAIIGNIQQRQRAVAHGAIGMKLGNLYASNEDATPGTPGTPGAPGTPGRAAPPKPQSQYVLRPKPGRSVILGKGQQLVGPKSNVPGAGGRNAGSKVIPVGLGGDKRYTISLTPGGRTRVTRRAPAMNRPRKTRRG